LVQLEPEPVTVAVPVEPRAEPKVPFVSLTAPLVETVSEPKPELPIVRVVELAQLDPAPVTVAAPLPLVVDPNAPEVLLTTPPLWTFSVPLPLVPTVRLLEFVQVEPAPLTVAVLVELAVLATVPVVLLTLPPLWIFSVPLPLLPTVRVPELAQLELAPLTVVVPAMPLMTPMTPVLSFKVAPEMTSDPVAVLPTLTAEACAVVVETSGPVERLIFAVSAAPGAPDADQFVPVDQSLFVAPVHVFVAACAGIAAGNTIPAVSAIAASASASPRHVLG